MREKYLARIIAARWTSLPTVGVNEAGFAIQIKLSILCTAPTNGTPTFCGVEAVIYFPPTILPSNPRKLKFSSIARDFLNNFKISEPLYPNHNPKLEHNGAGIICEFGPTDPINGYQSIMLWEPIANNEFAGLITTAIKTRSGPQILISGLQFPMEHVVTRNGKEVNILSLREWHALKLLAENHHYNGEDLVKHAWTNSGKVHPGEAKETMYHLIPKLRAYIKKLQLGIVNDRNGNYSLRDRKSKTT